MLNDDRAQAIRLAPTVEPAVGSGSPLEQRSASSFREETVRHAILPDVGDVATGLATREPHTRDYNRAALVGAYAGPIAALIATGWWLIELTRSWAGRDAPSVTVGAALLAIAVLLIRPDRVLPHFTILLATALSVAAFVVPLTAPTGWAGAPDGALYACGAWLAVVVAATVVRRPEATLWLLVLLVASAPIEFMSGWVAWWGGKDPTRPMIGTFYWHNPYAAFLVAGGLVGLAFWVWRRRIFAVLGLLSFSFAAIGIVYSTSRASLAVFIVGFALIGVGAIVNAQRWRSLRQVATAAVVGSAATFFVGGPPFFPHRSSPVAGEQSRTAGQSLGQNGGYRLDFWRDTLGVFRRHPLTGGGYKSLVHASVGHAPKGQPLSPYAHNGYLQPLGEGGLILGIPFLVAAALVAYLCVRAIIRGLVRRQALPETVVVAIALAMVMLHSFVDFDWTYAAGMGLFAILAGLVVGLSLRSRTSNEAPKPGQIRRWALVGCLVIGIGTLGISAWVQRDGNHTINLPRATQAR